MLSREGFHYGERASKGGGKDWRRVRSEVWEHDNGRCAGLDEDASRIHSLCICGLHQLRQHPQPILSDFFWTAILEVYAV